IARLGFLDDVPLAQRQYAYYRHARNSQTDDDQAPRPSCQISAKFVRQQPLAHPNNQSLTLPIYLIIDVKTPDCYIRNLWYSGNLLSCRLQSCKSLASKDYQKSQITALVRLVLYECSSLRA